MQSWRRFALVHAGAWYWACRDEAIKPGNALRLPLLFAIDARLEFANGNRYSADCLTCPKRRARLRIRRAIAAKYTVANTSAIVMQ